MKGAKGAESSSTEQPPEDLNKDNRTPTGRKVEVVLERKIRKRRFDTKEPQEKEPELLYQNVPPVQPARRPNEPRRDLAAELQAPAAKNYELRAPVEDGELDEAETLAAEIFGSLEVGVPLNKLLNLSPRLLKQAKKLLTKKRVAKL